MTVIVPERGRSPSLTSSTASVTPAYVDAWRLLGWLGVGYFVMSLIDLALGWYPLGFGSSEWEFGTISATMAGLAVPTLSLYLILGSALSRERRLAARIVAVIMIVVAVALAMLCIVYLTSIPIALNAVAENSVARLGIQKAIGKSLMLFVGYETLLVVGALCGFRRARVA